MTDCIYYNDGRCAKGLPNTPCEIKGCVAYYPKSEAYVCDRKCCYYNRTNGLPLGMCDYLECRLRMPKLFRDKI